MKIKYILGFALPVSKCDLNMTTSQKGILASACFAGIILVDRFKYFRNLL